MEKNNVKNTASEGAEKLNNNMEENNVKTPVSEYVENLKNNPIYSDTVGLITALKSMGTIDNTLWGSFKNRLGVRHYEKMFKVIGHAVAVYKSKSKQNPKNIPRVVEIDNNVKKNFNTIKGKLEKAIKDNNFQLTPKEKKEKLEFFEKMWRDESSNIMENLYIIEFYEYFLDFKKIDFAKIVTLDLNDRYQIINVNSIEYPKITKKNELYLECIFQEAANEFLETLESELINYCDPKKKRNQTRQAALRCLLDKTQEDLTELKQIEDKSIREYIKEKCPRTRN